MSSGGDRHVALVHHWLVSRRGGERVLDALSTLLPGATLHTLVHDRRACAPPREVAAVKTSWLQLLPAAPRTFRALLPLHPSAWRAFDLSGCGLVLSSDAALAKTVRAPAGVHHLCYCYSPPRWAWDLSELYLRQAVPAAARPLVRSVLARTREADLRGAAGVSRFIAISEHVRRRIASCYGRQSEVVHPPVDTDYFVPDPAAQLETDSPDLRPYLLLGEAVPYKRFEVALAACERLDRPLVVAGGGRRLAALAGKASHRPRSFPTRFVPDPDDAAVRRLYQQCRALLFPGEEDFGLVPVEVMACGRPVIALARGGAVETVVDGRTGCLYGADLAEPAGEGAPGMAAVSGADGDREVEALVAALLRFERELEPRFDPGLARARAETFSRPRFLSAMSAVLATC